MLMPPRKAQSIMSASTMLTGQTVFCSHDNHLRSTTRPCTFRATGAKTQAGLAGSLMPFISAQNAVKASD
jgi:hypothetical protein